MTLSKLIALGFADYYSKPFNILAEWLDRETVTLNVINNKTGTIVDSITVEYDCEQDDSFSMVVDRVLDKLKAKHIFDLANNFV